MMTYDRSRAAVRKHEVICARMTDLHSEQARPITILIAQMDALRTLNKEGALSKHMPTLEGWADLAPFRSTGHEYDK